MIGRSENIENGINRFRVGHLTRIATNWQS